VNTQTSPTRGNLALILLALLVVLMTGCNVGPKYTKPAVPAAPAYSEPQPGNFTEANGWNPAHPSDSKIRGDWWQIFSDPRLSTLEPQVPLGNSTLRAAEASFRQARALIQINRSALYPTVGVAPTVTRNRISANNPIGAHGLDYGQFELPVNVSFDADLWGRIRRTIATAKEQYQASAADIENVKLELQSELAVDYFEVRSLDRQKQILDFTVIAYEKALQLTRNRFQGGVASKVEVEQAQTQLDQTQAQDLDVSVARKQYEHAMAVLIGKLPEEFHLPPAPLTEAPPPIPVGVPSQLLERRPDIAYQERLAAAANEQIGIAQTAFFPDLVINGTGGLLSGSIVNWFTWPSRFWAVGPQLAETIFDQGRRRAQVESARAGYDITIANYRQVSLVAFQEVEDNLAALQILEQESAKQHEATIAAEASLQLALNRYKGGLSTYLEVITSQSIALTNERTEADLLRRRMDSSVQLIKALGGGWDTSKLPNG